jgi:hypothetical protein
VKGVVKGLGRGHAGRRALAAGLAALSLACSGGSGETPVLAASDLVAGGSFDAGELVPSAAMKDAQALDVAHILAFLEMTPYGGPSFLVSYTSHGQSAAEAITAAAQSYGINPIVLLARAEMDQGLVEQAGYPSPPSRVEFAFGCGCSAPGDCDPQYAGFDIQLDCLGAALRESLDAVGAHGKTDGGWGPGIASTTLDGVTVKPRDDSTAALYQYTPVVAVGQPGGNWVLWNLWTKYAKAVGYAGPKP